LVGSSFCVEFSPACAIFGIGKGNSAAPSDDDAVAVKLVSELVSSVVVEVGANVVGRSEGEEDGTSEGLEVGDTFGLLDGVVFGNRAPVRN